jgi:hypothetical protein
VLELVTAPRLAAPHVVPPSNSRIQRRTGLTSLTRRLTLSLCRPWRLDEAPPARLLTLRFLQLCKAAPSKNCQYQYRSGTGTELAVMNLAAELSCTGTKLALLNLAAELSCTGTNLAVLNLAAELS